MRIITEEFVQSVLSVDMALVALEEATLKKSSQAEPALFRIDDEPAIAPMRLMGGTIAQPMMSGLKAYVPLKPNVSLLLFSRDTGQLQAVVAADHIGRMRTAATSAMSVKYMARPESQRLGVIGSGKQARTQLQAVLQVRGFQSVHVFSPNAEHCAAFCREMSSTTNVPILPVGSLQEATWESDVIICATTSKSAFLTRANVRPGTHIVSIGANTPGKREVDEGLLAVAKVIGVDSAALARKFSGDLLTSPSVAAANWSNVLELGDLMREHQRGRSGREDITIFKSHGSPLGDVALGAAVLARAEAAGAGAVIDLYKRTQ